MALEEFKRPELNKREKGLIRMQSITNYVMGVMIVGAGIVFFVKPGIVKEKLEGYDPLMIYILASVCIVYGLFRIYRGYKKNYFRNS